MSRFTNDIDTVSEMINSSFASVISSALTFISTVTMMLVLNWQLTLISFGFLVLMFLIVKVIGGKSRTNFQRQQAALGALNGYIEEMIDGQKVVKVFNHEGKSIDEVYEYAQSMIPHMSHWVTVDDLNHLKRGGRISATTAFVGSMLSIKPIIYINEEGKLINIGKARGRKPALLQVVSEMEKRLLDPSLPMFISHGDCEEDAKFVAEEVTKRTGAEVKLISYVGPVIGSHTGAGVIALCFVGKER
jgi:ABC-type multidrug transport system fused ATPase/permease subunit